MFVLLVGLPLAKSVLRARALPPPIGAPLPLVDLRDENGARWTTSELAPQPFIACWLDDDRGMWRRLAELTVRLKYVPPSEYRLVAMSGDAAPVRLAGELRLAALPTARLGIGPSAPPSLNRALFDDRGGCILVDGHGRRRGRYQVSHPESMTRLVADFASVLRPNG